VKIHRCLKPRSRITHVDTVHYDGLVSTIPELDTSV